MNTFNKLWGVVIPAEAKAKVEEERQKTGITTPNNLEEQAQYLVGAELYEKLIKHYTEKQWGRPCRELPAFIIKRLPLRFTYDNNYFNDKYQGIPKGGYTPIVEKLLSRAEVLTDTEYFGFIKQNKNTTSKTVFTGMIDEYFGFCYGPLEYRTVRFETETLNIEDYQGVAVVNYTDPEHPYTRIIEHKHFEFNKCPKTVISREFSENWKQGIEPYYPVNTEANNALYAKYRALADKEPNMIFGGRLGEYKYYDMDKVIAKALEVARAELQH